jgi:hypothetical protein
LLAHDTSQVTVTVAGKHGSPVVGLVCACPSDEWVGVHPHVGGTCASYGFDW